MIVDCVACGHRDGRLHLDRGVVTHPGDRICPLPPRVPTPELPRPRYPSPWVRRAPGGGWR